jgi:predicted secreted protein
MTTTYAGKDFRVMVTLAGVDYPIPGEQSSVGSVSSEYVNVSNKDNLPWQSGLPVGVLNSSIKVRGVVFDQVNKVVHNALMSSAFNNDVLGVKIDSGAGSWIPARYQVTSIQRSGEYNGADMFDISLSRYGDVEVPEPPTPPVEIGLAYAMDRFSDGIDGELVRPSLYKQFNSWSAS